MSRSYAKRYRFCNIIRGMKKAASKKVRKTKDFDVSGGSFKKVFQSWDICDCGGSVPIPTSTVEREKELREYEEYYYKNKEKNEWWADKARRK